MRRFGAYAVDQGLSSASNFATLFLASTLVDGAEFGAFALGASLFGLVLGVARSTSSERVAARAGGEDGAHPLLPASLALLVAVSVALAALLAVVTLRDVVLTWAVAGPLTLVHDRLRFVALRERPNAAVVSDGVWLACTALAWGVSRWLDLPALGATALLAVPGPLVGTAVLLVAIRQALTLEITSDVRATIAELRFVADSWLQAAAVFVSLALVAGIVSLPVAGRCRTLMLVFQPFVSLSYAGRISILTTSDSRWLRRWPRLLAATAAAYGALAGVVLAATIAATTVPEVWAIGVVPFVLMWVAQVARAYHQGIVDVSRRGVGRGIVGPRTLFAVSMVVGTVIAVPALDFVGFTLAFAIAYTGAAVAAHLSAWRTGASTVPGRAV